MVFASSSLAERVVSAFSWHCSRKFAGMTVLSNPGFQPARVQNVWMHY